MATPTFKLYQDAGLTTEFVGPLVNTQDADGTTAAQDYQLFIGSTVAGKTMRTKVNPGVDNITLNISDNTPANGPEATDIKLATTLIGLDSAVAGDPLLLGVTIASGVPNAVAIFIRITAPAMVSATYNHLSIADNGTEEV